MKRMATLFFVYVIGIALAYGGSRVSGPELVDLPEKIQLKISADNEVELKDVHSLPGGTVGFDDAYVSAVVFEDGIKNCSIFIYSSGGLYGAYDGAPCEFVSAAEIDRDGAGAVPDVYYKVNVFSLSLGAVVSDVVAFYYDAGTRKFCESKLLAAWKINGKKGIRPKLVDGICGAVD
ncbi:hypothetical protein [Pseudomonas sp. B35(2017)]|uniref:hypothetical protein n=1 Tax=Pseudomonas sp. B35(2017) TaxID=1981722 RepID=UPI00111C60A4|nr:hypothetical protein [Pseudomonas sp. B35(2017)]